jgi:hypothetical protein
MIDIGWLNTYDSIEYQKLSHAISIPSFVAFEPERYVRKPENTGNRSIFTNCPAYQQFNRNTYIIRSPIDISLDLVQTSNGGFEYNCRALDDKVSPDVLKTLVEFNPDPNSRVDFAYPVIQLNLPYVFFADVPVTIQQFPAIYEPYNIPGIMIPGEFDIHAWQRSINWSIEWRNTSQPLIIKRGDPLCYVKFIVHNDPAKKIQLVRLRASDELIRPVVRAQGSSNLGIKTFDLFEIARKWRSPKYITNKNIWKPGD